MLLQAAKYIGAGLATIGLAGAGVGIGTGAWKKHFFLVNKSIKSLKNISQNYLVQLYSFLIMLMIMLNKTFIALIFVIFTQINKLIYDEVYFAVNKKIFVLKINYFKQRLEYVNVFMLDVPLKLLVYYQSIVDFMLFLQRVILERKQKNNLYYFVNKHVSLYFVCSK